MSQIHEVVLAIIPGAEDGERLAVVHKQSCAGSRIELRQQTWGEGIGWFTQNSLPLEPEQVAQLRATLGGQSAACASDTLRLNATRRSSAGRDASHLRIHAESA